MVSVSVANIADGAIHPPCPSTSGHTGPTSNCQPLYFLVWDFLWINFVSCVGDWECQRKYPFGSNTQVVVSVKIPQILFCFEVCVPLVPRPPHRDFAVFTHSGRLPGNSSFICFHFSSLLLHNFLLSPPKQVLGLKSLSQGSFLKEPKLRHSLVTRINNSVEKWY